MISVFSDVFFLLHFLLLPAQDQGERSLEYNGGQVNTTYRVDGKFLGRYTGAGRGYLVLREDGTGLYRHDYHVRSAQTPCPDGDIQIVWGLILDEEGEIVRFERPYGYSYPVIYVSRGTPSFQSCTRTSMLDYILEYRDGGMGVSSSDDWRKAP